jgi:hypothetical protein
MRNAVDIERAGSSPMIKRYRWQSAPRQIGARRNYQ